MAPVGGAAPSCARSLAELLVALSAARALPKGQQLHGHLLKAGHLPAAASSHALLAHHLLTFYARCSLPDFSLRAFLDLPAPPSAAAWSSLISSFAQNGLPAAAFHAFRRMLAAGVPPTDRSIPSAAKAVAAAADSSRPALAPHALHGLASKTPFAADVFVGSALLDMYAKCGNLPDARRLFDEMPERNVVSWSALIGGYADAGMHHASLLTFRSALTHAVQVNDFTVSCIVRVCAAATLFELGAQVHARSTKTALDASPFVGSSLVSLYSKCGLVDCAYRVFSAAAERNLGIWNAVLIASAQHGHTAMAFQRFTEMQTAGFRPNYITFLCLLTACSHAGLVDQGKRYFSLMKKEHGIEPQAEHYAAMVDLLGRVGRIPEALELIESMPMEPPDSVWGALLMACRMFKDADTAAIAAKRLFETGSRSSGAHMLLSSTYAAAGRHVDAALARKAMRDAGVRKETGLSWLEAAGEVHTFVSNCRRHPRSTEIYSLLEKVGAKMEAAGYVADTAAVVKDVDRDEKRATLGYHSERLAIGLGLLIVPEGVPIRVMKNLRVCDDCHNAVKYLSKCTGRVVVLRDNRRFHRFEDGLCSCGDFW
ncbi:putative pentatricopeptide repeat-containing protein At5g52630 [Lolium perenne]|uniref:putative pentatricopeptide repeat-containing protein At5g52630 n=1 Tax=Lolium perenne TaxID=4522 RepID=UPI0021EAED89|nr:putative pentatricopeptide repeat-containing protein At5g52630 [Lolium perenne]